LHLCAKRKRNSHAGEPKRSVIISKPKPANARRKKNYVVGLNQDSAPSKKRWNACRLVNRHG
jgi:hypothetical protein